MNPNPNPNLRTIRNTPPTSPDHLWNWVNSYTGVKIARAAVCRGHQAPFDAFSSWWLDPRSVSILLGPRGGGKSFLSALDTHLKSRFIPKYGTRVLGGSRAQSEQVYRALKDLVRDGGGLLGSDADTVQQLLKTVALYKNGSEVSILAASPTSVRGPHVPSLKLDEVDEIAPDIREAAMGMSMARRGAKAQVLMTSTWHRLGGPMSGLIEQAREGKFRLHGFCLFEVLERCPDSRSGPKLEKCPECALMKWCHSEGDVPKAKRSSGHYSIEAAIQKVLAVSLRTFEADYLCLGPRADGLWFPSFSAAVHMSDRAEYDPALPVNLAFDSGVFTGAVFFQVRHWRTEQGPAEEVHCFADYLSENISAEANARALLALSQTYCNGRLDVICTDPAGGARNPVGPTVIGEYERSGLKPLKRWPVRPVADGLTLLDSFIQPAEGPPRLLLHPRCTALGKSLAQYRRAKRGGQWMDYPEDPQHPWEDLVDSLRGGLNLLFPAGRRPSAVLRPGNASRILY